MLTWVCCRDGAAKDLRALYDIDVHVTCTVPASN